MHLSPVYKWRNAKHTEFKWHPKDTELVNGRTMSFILSVLPLDSFPVSTFQRATSEFQESICGASDIATSQGINDPTWKCDVPAEGKDFLLVLASRHRVDFYAISLLQLFMYLRNVPGMSSPTRAPTAQGNPTTAY